MTKHFFAAMLCIIVMLAGWHDTRLFLPLLPYIIDAARHIIPDARAALAACAETDEEAKSL